MAWIESHQELARHPKTKRLARAAGISIPAAIGHLHLLWWWALDYAQDGDLGGYTDEDIADAMEWNDTDASILIKSLESAGFIDRDGETFHIHDWHNYAGRLIEQREARTVYKQRQYELYKDLRLTRAVKARDDDICQYCGKTVNWNDKRGVDGGTYDHIDPEGENTLDNIVVSCRSCNSKKGKRTPRQAKMPFIFGGYTFKKGETHSNTGQINGKSDLEKPTITVPDLTVPDHTRPNQQNQDTTPLPPTGGTQKEKAPPKTKYADFVSMTNDEYSSLVAKLGEAGAARCIEILDNYKGANGKKYKSDYRAILNWVISRYEEERPKAPAAANVPASPFLREDL